MALSASLREGGGFAEGKDGRSLRNFEFVKTLLYRTLPHRTASGAPSRREPIQI